ncbi:unnamed protein product [Gongylonema pulchrum]|uniref:H15 domain-containing protein n=1 Tax=Gongylonema pulchrum TaxID=637853 RepID=A0A183DQA4_9BILA|nr:unnamed protein product [Gongylonema pulchrum]
MGETAQLENAEAINPSDNAFPNRTVMNEQNAEENGDAGMDIERMPSEGKEGEMLEHAAASAASEVELEDKYQAKKEVEDELEKTINEVAEASLESAAVEGEDLISENRRKGSKYDWNARIVRDIVRRVKNHKLSYSKAAEQLSLLMDAKVTTIGVRLQVVKMASDEAYAKQDQLAANESARKASKAPKTLPVASAASKSAISDRTRSKTTQVQKADNRENVVDGGAARERTNAKTGKKLVAYQFC